MVYRQAFPASIVRHQVAGDPYDQMRQTIRLIGRAITDASTYLPLRNHAASVASTAPPKDYLAQVRAIYGDVVRRWRYVKDPVSRELLTRSPEQIWRLVLAGDGIGVGAGRGAGDCDDVAAATGALLESIGSRVRIGVTAPIGSPPGRMFGHVFVQTLVPGHGWITVDPVLHPHRGFGAVPYHSRIAFFNLNGELLEKRGNVTNMEGVEMAQFAKTPDLSQWTDVGLGSSESTGQTPEDWRRYGLPNFGAYVDSHGIIDGLGLAGLSAEVTPQLYDGQLVARTPMIELRPKDYRYMQIMRRPYVGMLGLGDDGSIYEYQEAPGMLGWGFFKRLWKGVKSVGKRIRKGIRKVVSKIPGGKYLIRLGQKVFAVAKKFVRPLTKFVGKYAAKLAPVAALIPGYGPAIAAGLYAAGKIANLMNTYGVAVTSAVKGVSSLRFKSKGAAQKFTKALKHEAEKAKRAKKGKIIRSRSAWLKKFRRASGAARRLARR